jgi:hypothetical protein
MTDMDPRRMREAACAGRRWAEEKAAALEGTSAQSWSDDWQAAWAGALSLEPHLPKIAPEELSTLIDHATDAARRRWTEILEAERALEDNQALDTETRALALCEALRDHVPAGPSVGREGSRVYLQDTSDAHETTVIADAARAVTDWQERHFGR